jgi:hypothetical protein
MWEVKSKIIDNNTHKFSLFKDGSPLTYELVILHWQENYEFRRYYFSVLEEPIFDAFFWENPPVAKSSLGQNYEFVLVNSPQLSRVSADSNAFQEKFNTNSLNNSIIAFENLGRDAELIVPCPITSQNNYAHLAEFIRNGPESQKHDLFVMLGNSLMKRINSDPIWVSTSGLGVYWLHIRLDSRPKYYSYQAYRQYSE